MADVPRADKSGAKVTAVQTLREFRRRLNFAQRRGIASPGALEFFHRTNLQFHRGLLSAAPPALGRTGSESHANGRKRLEPVSSTMGNAALSASLRS
jgi:hypothetical protein